MSPLELKKFDFKKASAWREAQAEKFFQKRAAMSLLHPHDYLCGIFEEYRGMDPSRKRVPVEMARLVEMAFRGARSQPNPDKLEPWELLLTHIDQAMENAEEAAESLRLPRRPVTETESGSINAITGVHLFLQRLRKKAEAAAIP